MFLSHLGNHSLVFPQGDPNEIFIQSGLYRFSFEDIPTERTEKSSRIRIDQSPPINM